MTDSTEVWQRNLPSATGNFNTMHTFEGDGNPDRTFEINFSGGYISESHVKAYMMPYGTADYEYLDITFVNESTVRLSAHVPVGWVVTIYRDTPKDVPLASFTDGALITAASLDRNAEQAIFGVSEMVDRFTATQNNVELSLDIANEAKVQSQVAVGTANRAEAAAQAAIRVPASESVSPTPSAEQRAGKLLAFNQDGNVTVVLPESGSASDVMLEYEKPTGASIVGARDGTVQDSIDALSNSVDDALVSIAEVQGKIDPTLRADLALSTGSSLITHRHLREGTTARPLRAALSDTISVKDFGAVGDGVADDTQALLRAVEATRNNAIALHFPKGVYSVSQPLNFTRPATVVGEPGARIQLTGGSHPYVFQMDFRDVGLDYWAYGAYVSNITVDGNGFAQDGFSLRGVISSTFDNLRATNITRAGLHCWWTQCNLYTNFTCSKNVELFTTTPQHGILIDYEEGAPNKRGTSADTFLSPVIEHTTEAGIEANFCSNSVFINGTSEGCKHGIAFGYDASDLGQVAVTNTVVGMDMEVNSGGDVLLRKTATGNLFLGCQCGFESPSSQIQGGSYNRWVGGSSSGFDFYQGARGNKIEGTILFGEFATIVDAEKLNNWESLYNINTGNMTNTTNPTNGRVAYSGSGTVMIDPLRASMAAINVSSAAVLINAEDTARDGMRLDVVLYNLSGAESSIGWSSRFHIGGFSTLSAGRQRGASFVWDANFQSWYCVGLGQESTIY